jgi:hypothetical protein
MKAWSRSHAQQTGFAPQVVAIKFDLPAPEGQFALTIEADAGRPAPARPRSVSSRGHARAVERAANADLLHGRWINAKPRRDLANNTRASPRQGPALSFNGTAAERCCGTKSTRGQKPAFGTSLPLACDIPK